MARPLDQVALDTHMVLLKAGCEGEGLVPKAVEARRLDVGRRLMAEVVQLSRILESGGA